MANLLNTNIGPERVEVIPQPTGTIQVPGAATAITAFVVRSTLAGAPIDVPVAVTSLEEAVQQFGDEAEMGEGFYALRGFYANAGTGNVAIIVNVAPTASGPDVLERGTAEAAGGGFIEDEGVLLSSLAVSSYTPATGALVLGASPDLSSVKVGDYFKDDDGRLFLISAVNDGTDTLTLPLGLITLAGLDVHSAGGLKVGSTAGKVVRLFSTGEFDSDALIQKGASRGSATVTGITGTAVSASAGGFLNMGAKVGDLLIDSASAVFYITAVDDDDLIHVDRAGVAAGAATVRAAAISIVANTKRSASSVASVTPQNSAAFSSSGTGFGILPTSVGPYPVGSLSQHFCKIGAEEKEILASLIVASGTLDSNFGSGPLLVYTASSGLIQFGSAVNLSTTVPGDVWRDASGTDFVINKVDDGADQIVIAPFQTVNTGIASSIRRGQVRINFVDTAFNPGIVSVPTFFEPANTLEIPPTHTGQADVYFLADAVVQDSDYIGTSADGKGLHALDNTDDVNLICIPSVTARTVQNALIDYCETERQDCFALLMIPRSIRKAATDEVLASVVISTIANGALESTISFSGLPNLSAVSVGDLLSFNGAKYLITDVDDADDKISVASTSITGSGSASIVAPCAVTYKEVVINNPSKRAAWYFNHVKVLRSSDSAILTVDPIGHVAGVMARIDANIAIGGVSRAPAGLGPAGLADTVDLDLTISENREGGPLRLAFINRLTSFPGAGRVIFGAYTADSATSPVATAEEQLVQVIRTNLFIKKSLERGLRAFIWDNFSPVVQAQAQNAIESFLRNNSYLFPAGRPESEQFQVVSVEPTTEDLAKGLMKFRVLVSTNVSIRFLEIALEFPIPQVSA